MTPRPPRAARWLAAWSLAAPEREVVLGDLVEEFADRCAEDGVRRARRWFWRQTMLSVVPNLHRRLTRPRGVRVVTEREATPMNGLLHDTRYAWRMIRRRPIVSAVALGSLATGLALSTVVFSLLNAVWLRDLPVTRAAELVNVLEIRPTGFQHQLPYPDYADYRARQRSFTDLAAYASTEVTIRQGEATRVVPAELVSGSYFATLGVRLRAGRPLTDQDDRVGAEPAVVVSESFWRRVTGRDIDEGFTSESVALNTQQFSIVGVAAEPFRGAEIGREAHVWIPIHVQGLLQPDRARDHEERRMSWLAVIGRLGPGVTVGSAAADLDAIEAGLAPAVGRDHARTFALTSGRQGDSTLPATATRPLTLLLGAALLVLLVACANVANLLLARATERAREMAVRTALGARGGRLARLVVVETLMIGAAGAVIALVVGPVLARLVVPFMGDFGQPVTLDVVIDWRVAAFVMAAMLATTKLAGLVPTLTMLRAAPSGALSEGARGTSASPGAARLRRGLVVAQFALSLALVAVAMLLSRTVYNLQTLPTGLDMDHVALVEIDPRSAQYDNARSSQYVDAAIARLEALPGVRAAGFGRVIPLGFGGSRMTVTVPGYEPGAGEDMELNFNLVSPGYHEAVGLQLVDGRWFDARDTADRPLVLVVNETMARRYWRDGRAVGQRLMFGAPTGPDAEVIGIVRDVKYRMLREDPRPSFYRPIAQTRVSAGVLHVRTSGPPEAMLDTLRQTVAATDPLVPVKTVRTLRDQANVNLTDERLAMLIAVVLGGAALLLAAVGLYGSMAYAVGQRTREIGVRVALGATSAEIRRLVLGQGVVLAGIGTVVGVGLALIAARLIESRLFGVAAADAVTLAGSAAVLAAIAIAASWVPARRASRIDPVDALRAE